jgi:hypothetical protein
MSPSTQDALEVAQRQLRWTARTALAVFLERWVGGTGGEPAAWDLAARISDVFTLHGAAEDALVTFLDGRRRGRDEETAVAEALDEVDRLCTPVALLEEADPPRVALTPGAGRVVRMLQRAEWHYRLAADLRYMVNARWRRDLPPGLPSALDELVPVLAGRYRVVAETAIETFLSYRKHCRYSVDAAHAETVIGFNCRVDRVTAGMTITTLCQYREEFGYTLRRARTATVQEIEQMAAAGLDASLAVRHARTPEEADSVAVRIVDVADETVRQRHLELAARRSSQRRGPSAT